MRLTKNIFIVMGLAAGALALTLLSGSEASAISNKDVIVVNTTATPVPVSVVDDAQSEPYIRTAAIVTVPSGQAFAELTFDVPDGKRLILESVAVQAAVPSPQKVRVALQSQVNPAINKYVQSWLPVTSPGPFLGVEYYIANQPLKLRQDAFFGTDEISVIMLRDATGGDASFSVTLFGYLVNR